MSSEVAVPAHRTAVTLADVAGRAGVSIATASFVLSGRGGSRSAGSPATKAKVRAAAEELGYVPNRNAQAMRTGRGGGIVLSLGTLDDPWGVQLANQVRRDALPHDLSTLVLADERWLEYLSGASADAAFITSVDFVEDGPERVRRLNAATQTGIVAFTAQMEPEGFDVISSTPYRAVAQAYRRLRGRHERVHLLAPNLGDGRCTRITLAHPRTRAFLEAVRDLGDGRPEDLVHVSPEGSRDTYRAGLEWLSGPTRPRAVICFTGYQAVALQFAAERLGLDIPGDLEIISIGDVPAESEYFDPISYYGVDDVFARISSVVIDAARDRGDRPGRLHAFDWQFFPGATTRDDEATLRDDE
ncbi:LacI family DNA-binding transcriptional regulator [Brachybacterium fresconis]|uniref:LacI family transcriptional regulator n=1 Tax=Brachybacterium fresconis TaxID=173363 RepID=A0ABS4YNH2_9MICO|nr:LacI family DNA-binding transcriptional regulator [Brachybacterium fresconis]MBP2410332.1 LacI family transcriptional regulator [Brachybacterium fresconis]